MMTMGLTSRCFLPLLLFWYGLGITSLTHAASIRSWIGDSSLSRWKWPNHRLFSVSTTWPSSGVASNTNTSTSQKEEVQTTDVIIVGCSLSGMSLALALLSKNPHIHIIMIEKKANLQQEQGATFGLAPNGQKAMQEICPALLAKLERKSIRLRAVRDGSGAVAAFSRNWMLPWWLVRDCDTLLQQLLRWKKQVTIYAGMNIRSITESPESVTVQFHHSNVTLTAPVLIGADGVHSFVRKHVLRLPEALSSGATVWRGHRRVNELRHESQALLRPLVGKHAPMASGITVGTSLFYVFNFHEKYPHTLLWVLTSKEPGIVPGQTTPLDMLQQYVQQHPEVEQTLEYQRAKALFQLDFEHHRQGQGLPPEWTLSTRLSTVQLGRSWGGRGRITLVGDAAHAMRPASGQGGSMAFEDAVILARFLAPYFQQQQLPKRKKTTGDHPSLLPVTATTTGASIPEILRAFEARRFPRVKSLSDDQREKADRAYRNQGRLDTWSDAYEAWVFEGPDASLDIPKG